MLIDAPLFWEQVRLGEDSGLELKEARFHGNRVSAPHRDGLADGFAAFANAGGGRVVLGVTDDREPQSLTPAQLDLLADRVTEICSDSITPPLDFSFYRVPGPPPARGGVLLVHIPANEPTAATDTQVVRDTGGSLASRSGHLPGIQGRLHPKINEGLLQPVHFNLNEPVRLTDSMGGRATLWFREMLGSSCVDYRYDR